MLCDPIDGQCSTTSVVRERDTEYTVGYLTEYLEIILRNWAKADVRWQTNKRQQILAETFDRLESLIALG